MSQREKTSARALVFTRSS